LLVGSSGFQHKSLFHRFHEPLCCAASPAPPSLKRHPLSSGPCLFVTRPVVRNSFGGCWRCGRRLPGYRRRGVDRAAGTGCSWRNASTGAASLRERRSCRRSIVTNKAKITLVELWVIAKLSGGVMLLILASGDCWDRPIPPDGRILTKYRYSCVMRSNSTSLATQTWRERSSGLASARAMMPRKL
jgi:hypothetical protein